MRIREPGCPRDSHALYALGGYSACCGKLSAIVYHGAFEATKMWYCGRMPGSSSSVPIGMMAMPRPLSMRGMLEPQVRQMLAGL